MERWRAQLAPSLRAWWHDHDRSILLFAVACMAVAAAWRLGNEVPRLLWEVGGYGAFELRLRYHEVHRWFAGLEVYGDVARRLSACQLCLPLAAGRLARAGARPRAVGDRHHFFFWLVCFVPGRARPIVLVTLGYVALTIFAISFQEGELRTVLLGWTSEPPQAQKGHANVHKWHAAAGAEAWALPASIIILFGFAAWNTATGARTSGFSRAWRRL
jgi:hypothetical protein